jgi:hypothetical protein
MVDWLVFTTTHRPFADRVLLSVLCSAPVDTALFLAMAGFLNWRLFSIGVAAKVFAGGLISLSLRASSKAARATDLNP